MQDMDLLINCTSSFVNVFQLLLATLTLRVEEHSRQRGSRNEFAQEPQSLRPQLRGEHVHPGGVAARPVEAGDQTKCDRVAAAGKDNRNFCGRRLGGNRGSRSRCDDHVDLPANQISRERRQLIIFTLGPAVLDSHVAALDVAHFTQTVAERGNERRERHGRCGVEEPDHLHRLLRACRNRPRGRRTAEQCDELAAFHCPVTPVLPTERIAPPQLRQETAALRHFSLIYVGLGSFTSLWLLRSTVRMSASHPKATELLRSSELTLSAKTGPEQAQQRNPNC